MSIISCASPLSARPQRSGQGKKTSFDKNIFCCPAILKKKTHKNILYFKDHNYYYKRRITTLKFVLPNNKKMTAYQAWCPLPWNSKTCNMFH